MFKYIANKIILIAIFLSFIFINNAHSHLGDYWALPPESLSPANNANVAGTSITFWWEDPLWWIGSGCTSDIYHKHCIADRFHFQIARDSGFKDLVDDYWTDAPYSGLIYTDSFPDNGQVYYWRVQGWKDFWGGGYSATYKFTNGPSAPPKAPALKAPLDGANVSGTEVKFQWSWSLGDRAADYYLEVATDPSFTNVFFGEWIGYYIGTILYNLDDNGKKYYWRVKSRNSLGESSFSNTFTFINGPSNLPSTPTLISPQDGSKIDGPSTILTWTPSDRASNYKVELSLDPSFNSNLINKWIGNYTSVPLTLQEDGKEYFWRVTAGNSLGESLPSYSFSFISNPKDIPEKPVLLIPQDHSFVAGDTVHFAWYPVIADDYFLQVAETPDFSNIFFEYWLGDVDEHFASGFYTDGREYFWRVKSKNIRGESSFSDSWSFISIPDYSPNPLTDCTPSIGSGFGLLNSYNHIDTCSQYNLKYFLIDLSRRAGLNGAMATDASILTENFFDGILTDEDNIWEADNQKSAVDAHVYSSYVYDYLLNRLNINSYDNAGSTLASLVEVSCTKNNAFWDGAKVNYCAGNFQLPFSGALDVVGHEWGHALTDRASSRGTRLRYAKESGALSEAFSDWLGTAVEHANGETNWTIGEGINEIRDLSNPKWFSHPDTYLEAYWVDADNCTPSSVNDYCGVHTDSGVPNKMFYLLSEGGMHNNVTVPGIGIDAAIKIAVLANIKYWPVESTFLKAREGMIKAAKSLYPMEPDKLDAVEKAWDAVKVRDTDNDSIVDIRDNCPATPNVDQNDFDADGFGDACDWDDDEDGVADGVDAFPFDVAEWKDSDGDRVGDNADNCDYVANPDQADSNLNGIGDACEALDPDNDGVFEPFDNCPTVPNPDQADFDFDGQGDACDDGDSDNMPDYWELLYNLDPLNPSDRNLDSDVDGLTNFAEYQLGTNPNSGDTDGDGLQDSRDAYPLDPQKGLQILSPLSGDTLTAGLTHTIQWLAPDAQSFFDLEYSTDNGASWTPVAGNVTARQHDWGIPPFISDQSLHLKIVGKDANGTVLESAIIAPLLIRVPGLTAPNGSEALNPGDLFTITWDEGPAYGPVAGFSLAYQSTSGGPWTDIFTGSGNPRTFDWTVPNTFCESTEALVRLTLYDGLGAVILEDTSDDFFTIHLASCPNGYSINISSGRCESAPACSTGTYDPVQNKCVSQTLVTYPATAGSDQCTAWTNIISNGFSFQTDPQGTSCSTVPGGECFLWSSWVAGEGAKFDDSCAWTAITGFAGNLGAPNIRSIYLLPGETMVETNEYFGERIYKNLTSYTYSCPDGGSLSGTTCTKTTETFSAAVCAPSGNLNPNTDVCEVQCR